MRRGRQMIEGSARQEREVEGFVRRGAEDVEGIVRLGRPSPDPSSQYL